jgi:hypothetical protein
MPRRDLVAAGALVAAVSLLFADVLTGSAIFYFRDLTTFYLPAKHVVREALLSGEFPYWNPYFAAGQPLAANPEFEVFYPLQWLVLLPDYEFGFALHVIVHVWLAALGMYALLRGVRLGAGSSFFGALALALSGYLLSLINLLPILFCVAWLPLILLFAWRWFEHSRPRDFALASLLLGVQLLVLEPVTIVQGWLLLAALGAAHGWRRRAVRNLAAAVAMVVAGVAVGAVQLFPALDHARDTVRAVGFPIEVAGSWSMPLVRPAELVLPDLLGGREGHGSEYWGRELYPLRGGPFFLSIHAGIATMVLALAAIVARLRGAVLFAGLGALSWLLAAGANTPLFRLLFDAGVFRSIRYPEKFATLFLVPLFIAAALACERLLRGDRRVGRTVVAIAATLTGLFAAAWMAAALPSFPEVFGDFWSLPRGASAHLAATFRSGLFEAAAFSLLLAVIAALAWRLGPSITLILLTVLTVANLAPLAASVAPRMPRRLAEAPPAADVLRRTAGEGRVFHEAAFLQMLGPRSRHFSIGTDVYWLIRNTLFPMTPVRWGMEIVLEDDFDETALRSTNAFREAALQARAAGEGRMLDALLAMSDVQAAVDLIDYAQVAEALRVSPETAEPLVIGRLRSHGRFHFARELVHGTTAEEFSLALRKADPRVPTAFTAAAGLKSAPGRIVREERGWSRAVVNVETDGEAFLVASMTGHRYWRASVDGRRVPIHEVNLTYMGVALPPGAHRVEFRYVNPLVRWSGVLSIVAIALLSAIAMLPQVRPVVPADPHQIGEHPEGVTDDVHA